MKILFWDCETSPNLGHVWSLWNQNISLNQLMESGEMLCFAAVWGDSPRKPMFYSRWQHGHEEMVHALWEMLDEADVVVTYNGKMFDTPWAQRQFVELGLPPPSPYRQVDLCQVVKREFRFPSNKLAYVSQRLLGETKMETGGHQLWVDVLSDVPAAQKRMRRYCIKDTLLLVPLYSRLLPWIRSHPSHAAYSDEVVCPRCGSDKLKRNGFERTQVSTYQRYKCVHCGSPARGTKRVSGAEVVQVNNS